MNKITKTQAWSAQIRANFLVLAILLVAIGLAYTGKYPGESGFNWLHAVLIALGTISAHISVNLFNEFSDFSTKIDFNTRRTPFSGGSGMLPAGHTRPDHVKALSFITLAFSATIGIYFSIVSHWTILPISIIGAIAIVFYTPILSRFLLGELFAGLALGTLVVIGTYIAMTASPGQALLSLLPREVLLASIPPGILTALLLFLNEFPDARADREGGRKHLVIALGYKTSSILYTVLMVLVFAVIAFIPLMQAGSQWLYLALIPLPLALKASAMAMKFDPDNPDKLIPAMGMNVMVVLGTDLLIALAVVLELVVS